MILLSLSPMRCDDALTLSAAGDVLTVNGEEFDFSSIPAGATLPREAVSCDWLASDVDRLDDGTLVLTLILPHGALPWPTPAAATVLTNPDPIPVTTDGPVELPAYTPEDDQ